MTSTRSFGRMRLPAAVSSLIFVETARMPGGENGGERTSLPRLDQLLTGYRLACEKRYAGDRTGGLVHGIRGAHARDVAGRHCILGPRLPAQTFPRSTT